MRANPTNVRKMFGYSKYQTLMRNKRAAYDAEEETAKETT
jgi:hypothetical protein